MNRSLFKAFSGKQIVLFALSLMFLAIAADFFISMNWNPSHLLNSGLFFDVGVRYYHEAFPHHLLQEKPRLNVHVILGFLLIVLGFLQLSDPLRLRHRQFHRWVGYSYYLMGASGVSYGVLMAGQTLGGVVSQLAFVCTAILWFVSAFLALMNIKKKQWMNHQAWSYKNFAITLSTGLIRPNLVLLDWTFPGNTPSTLFAMSCWFSLFIGVSIWIWIGDRV